MLICITRSLKKLTSSLCEESRIPRRKPCLVMEHDDTYCTLYIRQRRAIQRQATAYYMYPASSISISYHIVRLSGIPIKCRHTRIILFKRNLLMARKRVSYVYRRAYGGLEGGKCLRNGARGARIQFPAQGSFQITQLSPNSRTHSPLSASAFNYREGGRFQNCSLVPSERKRNTS